MRSLLEIDRCLRSPDPEERRRATTELGFHPPATVAGMLLGALGDEDWRVRKEAVGVCVGMAPNPEILRRLVETFAPGEDNVGLRNAAVEALAGYGGESVDALGSALTSFDADGRKLAVEALGRSGHIGALVVLRSLVTDEDPNVRSAAVESLAALGSICAEAVAPLLESLLSRSESMLQLAALNGLNEMGVAVPWSRLEPLLDDPILRNSALVAAGRSAEPPAAAVLVGVLGRSPGLAYDIASAALVDFVRLGQNTLPIARQAMERLGDCAIGQLLERARASEPNRRRPALLLLGVLGGREAAQVAVEALPDERLTCEAEEALLMIGAPAVPALITRIAQGEPSERALCIRLLSELADDAMKQGVAQAVSAALTDESVDVQAAALTLLAKIGNEHSLAPAAQLLGSPSSLVRRGAVGAVAAIARRSTSAAVSAVRSAAPDGDSTHAAIIILASLEGPLLGHQDADVAFLSDALAHASAHVRRAAIEALARYPQGRAVEAVAFALSDEEQEVRIAAVRTLGQMRTASGSPAGVERLLALVQRRPDDMMMAEAVRALGVTADPKCLPVLRYLVQTAGGFVAVSAQEAIGQIKAPAQLDALLDGLRHPNSEVVKASLQQLAEVRTATVSIELARCLDHGAWDVRRLAADLLGALGGEGVTVVLRRRLGREQEPLVREAIQRALIKLEGSLAPVRRTTPPPTRGGSRP